MNEDHKNRLHKAISEMEPSLETILDFAASADPQIRAGALRLLAASVRIIANEDVLACMMKGLRDPDWKVGRAAEDALEAIGRPFVTVLLSLLEGADVGSRTLAARALSVIEPSPEDVQVYTDSLLTRIADVDESDAVQQLAAVGLARSAARVADPDSFIGQLKNLQQSPDEGVASATKYVLERVASPACPSLPRFLELIYQPGELKPDEALHIPDCHYCRRIVAMCEDEVEHIPIEAFLSANFTDAMEFHLSGIRCSHCVEMKRLAARIRSEVGDEASLFADTLNLLSNISTRLHSLAAWIGLMADRTTRAFVANSDSFRNIFSHRIGAMVVMVLEAGQQIPRILSDKTESLRSILSPAAMGLFPAGHLAPQLRDSAVESPGVHDARIDAWQAPDPRFMRIALENLPTEKEVVTGVLIAPSSSELRVFAAKRAGNLWVANIEHLGTGEIVIFLEPLDSDSKSS